MTNWNLFGEGLPEQSRNAYFADHSATPEMAFTVGWNAAVTAAAEDIADLRFYEGLGTKDDLVKAVRQAQVLTDYVDSLPTQIRRSWQSYLKDKDAL